MGYDVYGATFSKVAGPNAPLDDSCAPTDQQTGSVTSALKQWTAAGFSSNQIMLGVASYGHGFRVPNSSIGNDPQKLAQFPSLAEDQTILGTAEAPGDYGMSLCFIFVSNSHVSQGNWTFVATQLVPAVFSSMVIWSNEELLIPREMGLTASSFNTTNAVRR